MISTGKIGQDIVITGENLFSINKIIFASEVSGRFQEVSNNYLICTVPQNAAWGRVRLESDQRNVTGYSKFLFVPEPIVTGWFPSTGMPTSTITIRGYAFSGVTGVTFNGLQASSVSVSSNFQLTAVLPTGNTNGQIRVIGQSGLSFLTSEDFNSIALISGLSSYSVRSGDLLTISGSNFLPDLMFEDNSRSNFYYVSFNGATGSFNLVNSTRMTGAIPELATSGPVNILRNINEYHPSNFSLTVIPSPPVISYLNPSSGKINDGTVIYGANFYNVTNIKLERNSSYVNITGTGNFTVSSIGNVIYFNIPSGLSEGYHNVFVSASGGIGSGINKIHILKDPIITGISSYNVIPQDIIRISGINLYDSSKVYFNSTDLIPYNVASGSSDNTYIDVEIPGEINLENTISVYNGVGYYNYSEIVYYIQKPYISGFTPLSGDWGDEILISGTGFNSTYNVYVNNLSGNFSVINNTGILFNIPSGSIDGYITIINRKDTSHSLTLLRVNDPTMSVTGITPNPAIVGQTIIISGTYFPTATGVVFSGVSGLISTNNFLVNSGNDITVQVPYNSVSQKIGVANEKGTFYSSNILTILNSPVITGVYPNSDKYENTITISGYNFTGTEFYFRKYNGELIKSTGTVIINSRLATTKVPKPIITDTIYASGIGSIYGSSIQFSPLPSFNKITPFTTGTAINDRLVFEITNGSEVTGIILSGSGIIRNIVDSYTDLSFTNTSSGTVIITGYLNGQYYGTGNAYPIHRTWTGFSNKIESKFTGLIYTESVINLTGAISTISGFYPRTGSPNTTIYISGTNLRRVQSIVISGNENAYSELGAIPSFDYVSDKLITGKIGNIMDATFKFAELKLRNNSWFYDVFLPYPVTEHTSISYIKQPQILTTRPRVQANDIFTGTALLVSGMYFQGLYSGFLRNSYGQFRQINIDAVNTAWAINTTYNEHLYAYIPVDQSLTDQNFDIIFINNANETGIISGVKITNKQDYNNMNELETKIYLFSK